MSGNSFHAIPPRMNWTSEQMHEYVSGRHQDAHVRRWNAERLAQASAHITTEMLLADMRKPFDPNFRYPVGC